MTPRTWVFAAGLLTGCTDPAAAAGGAAPPVVLPSLADGVLHLPAEFAARIGLRSEPVRVTDIAPILHVTGVLEFDAQRIAAVGSRIWGRVREVHVIEGTRVAAGDLLATLESAELGTAQAETLALAARVTVAEADRARKVQLLAEGIGAQRELDSAAASAASLAADLKAARQRVHALAGSRRGSLGVMTLTSPIAGAVVGVQLHRGQAVEPSHTAFMIADAGSLWVRLAVFEGEVGNVRVGDRVEVSAMTRGEPRGGSVTYVSSMLDPVTRSAEVRVVVPNPDGSLRAGQAVRAAIRPGAAIRRSLAVPRTAIVQVDGKPTLFVAVGELAVVARPVELGIGSAELIEVVAGLVEGEAVVVDGVFALKSELFR